MSFHKIFDLIAGMYFNFYNITHKSVGGGCADNAVNSARTHPTSVGGGGADNAVNSARTLPLRLELRIECIKFHFDISYFQNDIIYLFIYLFIFILRRMWKNKALAHHTSTYFHTRRVSI